MPINTEFIDALASSAPTPGGGGASAYCGALAAALASMVGNLTVGKKTYAAVEDQVQAALADLEAARAHLVQLIDDDAQAFLPVFAVYRMPKDTPQQIEERKAAMEAAIDGACDVPLRIMDACSDLLDTCEFMAHNGSKMVRSDAGCAAVLAKAAIQSASLSVFVNVACMDDKAKAARYRDLANRKVRRSSAKADAIYSFVVEQVDPADE